MIDWWMPIVIGWWIGCWMLILHIYSTDGLEMRLNWFIGFALLGGIILPLYYLINNLGSILESLWKMGKKLSKTNLNPVIIKERKI